MGDGERDYVDYGDLIEDVYGDTNPWCPGHVVNPNGEFANIVWCDFTTDCSAGH